MNNNREKSLFKNTIIIAIGKSSTQLITFLLLPLYTNILSTEEYGLVDLLNTLVFFLLPIVTCQIEQAVFRELIEERNNDNKKTEIITSSIFTVIFQCLVYSLIFIIISPMIKNNYKIFLATNVIAQIFSSLFLQISRGLGDNKKYSIGSCICALSTIFFNILFLVCIKLGANGMLLGTLLGQLSCSIYLFIFLKLHKYIQIKSFNKKCVKKMLKYSIPLIPNAICWWIFNTSDRVIVSAILGLSANGLLSVASKFSVIVVGLYNMFNMSWTESISMHIKDSDIKEYFNNMFNTILSLFSAMIAVMIAFMPIIYKVMVSKDFIGGYNIVPILLISSLFNVIVGLISVLYIAKKDTKSLANTSIFSAIINIITHLALIKSTGLYAAAISTFIAYSTMSLYRLYDIRKKYFTVHIEKSLILKTCISFGMIMILYYINNIYLNILSMIISIIYAYSINKNSIKTILNLIKNKFVKA